jgi:hypothetical protein
MAEPTEDASSTPSAIRCPWCSAELADPEATTCPSCQANLVGDADKQLPGLTAVDLEKLAFRRALPQKKSRIMSWISGDLDYEDATEPIAPPGSLDRPPIEVRREMLRLERAALIAELAAEAGAITADMVLDQETDPSAAAAAIQAHVDDAAAAEAVDTEVPLEELAAVSPEPTETEAALHAQADPDAEPDAVSGTLDSSAAADPSARGA